MGGVRRFDFGGQSLASNGWLAVAPNTSFGSAATPAYGWTSPSSQRSAVDGCTECVSLSRGSPHSHLTERLTRVLKVSI